MRKHEGMRGNGGWLTYPKGRGKNPTYLNGNRGGRALEWDMLEGGVAGRTPVQGQPCCDILLQRVPYIG